MTSRTNWSYPRAFKTLEIGDTISLRPGPCGDLGRIIEGVYTVTEIRPFGFPYVFKAKRGSDGKICAFKPDMGVRWEKIPPTPIDKDHA